MAQEMVMKPYQQIPIQDCGEPLVAIPGDRFGLVQPPPYLALGAPYGEHSPYYLRASVLEALIKAQTLLQGRQPQWQIQIFDAYRPIAVQQFMVDHSYQQLLASQGLGAADLSEAEQAQWLAQVYQFWAPPSLNPQTPPPHSTGAALDVTLLDSQGQPIHMGSDIDEMSERSYPNHFANATDAEGQTYHRHRQLLLACMSAVGFCQHPNEWWHFSLGDQLWAWSRRQVDGSAAEIIARYGSL
jgi:zinc D-Ala-D-Ala dipeptidase